MSVNIIGENVVQLYTAGSMKSMDRIGGLKEERVSDSRESINLLLEDFLTPIYELFKSISLNSREKFLILQIVIAMLIGVVTSKSADYNALSDTNDINLSINNFYDQQVSELEDAAFCVQAKPGITVNVRSGQGTNYPVISSISGNKALPLDLEEPVDGWYRIKTSDGSNAWISADYVEKMSCDEYVAAIESNQPFVHMSKVVLGNVTVFNMQESIFAPEVFERLVSAVRARASTYEGARESGRPIAIVFGDERQMNTLVPSLEQHTKRIEESTPEDDEFETQGVSTQIVEISDGILAPVSSGYSGTVYEMAFVRVYEGPGEASILKVLDVAVHEVMHVLSGEISFHQKTNANGGVVYDYEATNPAVYEARLALTGIDGPDVCQYYEEKIVEACTLYAEALFGDDNILDTKVYPQLGSVELANAYLETLRSGTEQ